MTDFRMNKKKPIGSRNLSTIAGINTGRRPKHAPSAPILSAPAFEITPNLAERTNEMSVANALGTMITETSEVVDAESTGDGRRTEDVRSDGRTVSEKHSVGGVSHVEHGEAKDSGVVVESSDDGTEAQEEEAVESTASTEAELAQDKDDLQDGDASGPEDEVRDTGGPDQELEGEEEAENTDSEIDPAEDEELGEAVLDSRRVVLTEDEDNAVEQSEESK